MPTYGRAGIYISEQLLGPNPGPTPINPSVAAFAGEHWRGSSGVAVLVTSWRQFVAYFGGFNPNSTPVLTNPYLPYAVYAFFANGGQACYVTRITSSGTPGATAAVNLVDSQATPQNTLSLTAGALGVAGNVGAWGNSLNVSVINRGGAGSGRFDLAIYYGGTAQQYLVETWTDLSMSSSDPRYAPKIINSPIQGSMWVVATDLNDAASPPNNAPNVVTNKSFSGGTDTTSPTTTDRSAAVTVGTSAFDQVYGVLNINMPGESTASVIDSLLTYAETRPYTFAVVDTASGQSPASAVAYEQSLAPVISQGAVYYPWLKATDPSSPNLQSTVLLPPGGFVLGQMVAVDQSNGVWRAPAGLGTEFQGVVAAERKFSSADLDTLNENNVNALRTKPNGQVLIWGARTLQTGYATLYVPVRRTLNYIEAALAQLLEFVIFAPNDQLLWTNITATCNQFLSGLYNAGAFPGASPATSYYVTCDNTNNTPNSIAQGIVNTVVGVALLYPAEFLNLTIAQFQNSGTTSVTTAQAA